MWRDPVNTQRNVVSTVAAISNDTLRNVHGRLDFLNEIKEDIGVYIFLIRCTYGKSFSFFKLVEAVIT